MAGAGITGPFLAKALVGSLIGAGVSAAAQSLGGGSAAVSTAKEPPMIEKARSEALRQVSPILLEFLRSPKEALYKYTGISELVPPLTPVEQMAYNQVARLYTTGTPFDQAALQTAINTMLTSPAELLLPTVTRGAASQARSWPIRVAAQLESIARAYAEAIDSLRQSVKSLGLEGTTYAQQVEDLAERFGDWLSSQAEGLREAAKERIQAAGEDVVQRMLSAPSSFIARLSGAAQQEAANRLREQLSREMGYLELPSLPSEQDILEATQASDVLARLEGFKPTIPSFTYSPLQYLSSIGKALSGLTTGQLMAQTAKDWFTARRALDKAQLAAAELARQIGGAQGVINWAKMFSPWAALPRERELKRRTAYEDLWKKFAEATMGALKIPPAGKTAVTTSSGLGFGPAFLSAFASGFGGAIGKQLLKGD